MGEPQRSFQAMIESIALNDDLGAGLLTQLVNHFFLQAALIKPDMLQALQAKEHLRVLQVVSRQRQPRELCKTAQQIQVNIGVERVEGERL